ncbi:MAG TPA: DUF4288 domain-containing protein [Myxococcus sp.]|jgi:hypothetical protein|nr:DUF4288 domain-containing protein [Myxococcus sp.]
MAYIPADAKWYLAEVVLGISVGRQPTVVVHINTLLVRADSPEEAYQRALELGKQEARPRYKNQAGEAVRFRFLGLRDLWVIHEELEHGAEVAFHERHVRSMQAARKLVSRKAELGVFAPRQPSKGPDYASAEIARRLAELFGEEVLTIGEPSPKPQPKRRPPKSKGTSRPARRR